MLIQWWHQTTCGKCNRVIYPGEQIHLIGLVASCYECSQKHQGYKSYAPTVIPIKLGEKMGKESSHVPGAKDDKEKLMWNLLPWKGVEGMVRVLTFGAKKYSPNGWRSVPDAKSRYQAALLRHLCALNAGERLDTESGLRHVDHILTNAAFLAELED